MSPTFIHQANQRAKGILISPLVAIGTDLAQVGQGNDL